MRKLIMLRILFIIIAFILTGLSYSFAHAESCFISVLDDTRKEIISISATGNNEESTLTIQSGKKMTLKNTMVLDSPYRIIYDIQYDGPIFTNIHKTLKNLNLKSIRVEYLFGVIRMVFDINRSYMPKFSHRLNDHELIILISTSEKADLTKDGANNNLKETGHTAAQSSEPTNIVHKNKPRIDPAASLLKKLTECQSNANNEESALFLSGVNAFKDKNFPKASDNFKNLIKAFPKGKYSEKAYYLLAKSYEQLYTESRSKHFSMIKNSYDDAINRFPSSLFTPDALLSAGNLCLESNYISEAISYCNRVIEKDIDSFSTVRALLQKGEALCKKSKYMEAISIYEKILLRNDDNFGKTEAEIGIAKALFETNSFQKSIDLLTRLEQEPENIYRYPDISLYLGYNYYQTGNFDTAINNLFKYYNIYPDSKINHLVLSKIGDAYRGIKMFDSASKIYKLAFDLFPQTEGALISLTRLAEQQESGELKNQDIFTPFAVTDNKLSSPREIYENVISEYLKKDSKNPMLEYTMLKLALLCNKEKNYTKSMEVLENLLTNYASSKLRTEIIYALTDNFEAIIKNGKNDEVNKAAYLDIVNAYLRRKNIIQQIAPPRTIIAVAEAYIRLGLEDIAADLLLQAEAALDDKEKPVELLYYLGKYYIENGQPENGLKRLDLLTGQYKSGEFVSKAYHIKGVCFQDNEKYEQAIEMFSQALKSNPEIEDKILILSDNALVLAETGLKDNSLEAAKEAQNILADNPEQEKFVYQKLGEVCLHIGKPEDALLLLSKSITENKDDRENTKIMFLIAQCHEALNRKSDCISVYNQLAKSNDPLWGKLAKEKMEAIMFKEFLSKKEFSKYRR